MQSSVDGTRALPWSHKYKDVCLGALCCQSSNWWSGTTGYIFSSAGGGGGGEHLEAMLGKWSSAAEPSPPPKSSCAAHWTRAVCLSCSVIPEASPCTCPKALQLQIHTGSQQIFPG